MRVGKERGKIVEWNGGEWRLNGQGMTCTSVRSSRGEK